MKLILIRHGETVENQQGILAGHLPGTLSEQGIKQAKMLALKLEKEKIDLIVSSDLARAADTAREIARFHPDIKILFDKRLRETDYRDLTGRHKTLFDFKKWSPDVESRESMQNRSKALLNEIYRKYPDDMVLFVGHAGINRALISVIMNRPPEYMKAIHSLRNTAISVFEIEDGNKHEVYVLNCNFQLVDDIFVALT